MRLLRDLPATGCGHRAERSDFKGLADRPRTSPRPSTGRGGMSVRNAGYGPAGI